MKRWKVNRVRKIQMILMGVFVCGVLLGGIGTGIAFVEYSSFAYAGEKTIGEEYLVTRQLDQAFDPAKGRVGIEAGWYGYEDGDSPVVADPSVPENLVRYEVTYNEKAVRPYVVYDGFEDPDQPGGTVTSGEEPSPESRERMQGRTILRVRYTGNDFALWMACKDDFLKELRERKIASYRQVTVADVKVKVNPATLPYVEYWMD